MGESFSIKKVPNYSFNCGDNVNQLKKWSFNEVKNPPESSSKFNNYVSESCWNYSYSFSDIFIYSGCGLFCCDYKDIKKGIIKLNLYILIK